MERVVGEEESSNIMRKVNEIVEIVYEAIPEDKGYTEGDVIAALITITGALIGEDDDVPLLLADSMILLTKIANKARLLKKAEAPA